MLKHRVIPSLLISDGGLVKTERFKNPKYVGDPVNAIRIFNEKEVDELMVLDIDASKVKKSPDYTMIEEIAGECFMPLCYGGGVRTLEEATRLFDLGVEKISVQSAALDDLQLVRAIAEKYGNQSVVISCDIRKDFFGRYRLYSSAKRKTLQQPPLQFIRNAVEAGAGEILLNSVDRDGTLAGPDLELIRQTAPHFTVPLIAQGGVSSLDQIRDCVNAGASAVAAGAFFVFSGPHRAVLITYPKYETLEQLFI